MSLIAPLLVIASLGHSQDVKPTLNIGDPAPALAYGKWLKGDQVQQFEKGKTYVVEFWATWCGPCVRSMPHLTELRRKYEGKVQFISMDVWEHDWAGVPGFITKQGERMDYPIAQDELLEPAPAAAAPGAKVRWAAEHGKASTSWLVASGYDKVGIPCSFVVDKDGKVAWIGDPNGIDSILESVTRGSWDMGAAAKNNVAYLQMTSERREIDKRVAKMRDAKDYAGAVKAIKDFVNVDPANRADYLADAFSIEQADMKDAAAATATAEEALRITTIPWIQGLSEIAFAMAFPADGAAKLDNSLCMRVAAKADEYERGQRVTVKRALAKFAYAAGNRDEAMKYSNDALALAKVIAPTQLTDIEKELSVYSSAPKLR
ncbi:MAG: redoxin family protein [Armatimonadetes bacterium]|nr:redoxin family protein [Armatimonadota bacterium]